MVKWIKKIENKIIRRTVFTVLSITCSIILVGAGLLLLSFVLGPPSLTNEQNTVYYSQDGKVFGEEHGVESRYWVELGDISPHLIQATLTTEDRDFYEHHGFDFTRILSAALKDIKSLSMKEGASTITQQYARNLYLSHEKTWTRKIKEAFYAIRLEMYYDKDEILEGYLNTIYYGHGAYGIEAASRYFLDKSASELSLSEAALLAAVPKGPSYYSPFNHLKNAKKRQKQILASLEEQGHISESEHYLAAQKVVQLTEPKERVKKSAAPYFQDEVLKELSTILDKDIEEIRSGGYQVYTTLDLEKQKELENQIKKTFTTGKDFQVGALVMDPKNGAIRSMVGGRNYKKSPFNRTTQAKRMPGSAFKPFLYYAALNKGYTATTSLMSKPTNFELENGTVYQPSNYNGYYAYEPITLAQALALSDNVYAVKTNLFLGPEQLVKTAEKFGIDSDLKAVPSLALGTGSVSVEEMVTGYSMLANGGTSVESYTIKSVTDVQGNLVYERAEEEEEEKQVLDPQSTFILTQLMTGMFDASLNGYMQVTGSSIAPELTRSYAGKSGTTKSDSWMIGYSPDLVTGIWTGYDQNKQIEKVKEHQFAKDVWAGFMEQAHEDIPIHTFPVPDGVIGAYVDPDSGELATPYCEGEELMYFVKGTEPQTHCSLHQPDDTNRLDQKEKNEDKNSGWKQWFEWLSGIGN